jgi:hypothetical protein
MLHMTIGCNLLNALGGRPLIEDAAFLPRYPGPLPLSIGGGLEVGLEPFSLDLMQRVFMEIEEPENPIDLPVFAAAGLPRTASRPGSMPARPSNIEPKAVRTGARGRRREGAQKRCCAIVMGRKRDAPPWPQRGSAFRICRTTPLPFVCFNSGGRDRSLLPPVKMKSARASVRI